MNQAHVNEIHRNVLMDDQLSSTFLRRGRERWGSESFSRSGIIESTHVNSGNLREGQGFICLWTRVPREQMMS